MLVAVNDSELRRLSDERDRFKQGYATLESDNAKLRELCEDMLSCIEIRAAFGRPPTEEMYEMFYKRARELGVDE